jgi:hypothetical protein
MTELWTVQIKEVLLEVLAGQFIDDNIKIA